MLVVLVFCIVFFFQAEDGIRYLVRSRGLGDVYKRQALGSHTASLGLAFYDANLLPAHYKNGALIGQHGSCLLYTSDAADERSSVDLGGRRIIKKKTTMYMR